MNAKKLLSTLLSAAMAVSMLAGCFGGGNKNYSDEAADAANAAQSTVVFSTDTTLAKSLQDALADGLTQLDEIDDAMEADENLKPLLTSGWDLDIFAAQGEDAEAAAKTIAEQYIVSAVIGKKAEGKIAMVLHDGNGYYYVAVLTYGSGGGSGSGGGAGGGSGSGDDDHPGGNPGGGDDDEEENHPSVLTTIEVTQNGTIYTDEELDGDNFTVKAPDQYGEEMNVDLTFVSADPSNSGDEGTKTISVTYKNGSESYTDENVTINVTKKASVLTGLKIEKDKSFFVGDTLQKDDLTVYPIYDGDNVSDTPLKSSEFTISGETYFTTTNPYTITVEYQGVTETTTITPKVVKVTSIELVKPQSGTVTRTLRAFDSDDTVFYYHVGAVGLGGWGIYDDISIRLIKNNGNQEEVLTGWSLHNAIAAGKVTATPNEFDWDDVDKTISVKIQYYDKDVMDDPVELTLKVKVMADWI